jgi:hypothetical protein
MRRVLLIAVAALALLAVSSLATTKPVQSQPFSPPQWSVCVSFAPGWFGPPFLVETVNITSVPGPKICTLVPPNFSFPPGYCGIASPGAAIINCATPCPVTPVPPSTAIGQVWVQGAGSPGGVVVAECGTQQSGCITPCSSFPGATVPLGQTQFRCIWAAPPNGFVLARCYAP